MATLDDLRRMLEDLNHRVQHLALNQEKMMSALDDANAAIQKIDAATTKQGTVLAAEATTLQQISDEMDALVAQAGGNVPPDVVSKLQALADRSQAVSDSLDQQAAFSTAIAAKGPQNPVPVPVPPPTPAP